MRLLTILLRFGTQTYPHAEDQMNDLFARHLAGVDRDVIVVDNALAAGFEQTAAGRTVIGGDNRFREFSGFDRAIAFVGCKLRRYDLVQFVTDAFHTLYVDYLDRFEMPLLRTIAGKAVALGHIDCYNQPIDVFGVTSQHWIRSCCFFFVSPSDVAALGSLTSVTDPERFFSGDPAAPFRDDAPLSRRYQEYLIDWIGGQSIGQGVQWHSSFTLTPDTLDRFEQKALTILNEHVLGVRLRAMGCRLIDVTWISGSSRRGEPVDLNTGWQRQLAARDHAALVVAG